MVSSSRQTCLLTCWAWPLPKPCMVSLPFSSLLALPFPLDAQVLIYSLMLRRAQRPHVTYSIMPEQDGSLTPFQFTVAMRLLIKHIPLLPTQSFSASRFPMPLCWLCAFHSPAPISHPSFASHFSSLTTSGLPPLVTACEADVLVFPSWHGRLADR